jgi:hypothetical protein
MSDGGGEMDWGELAKPVVSFFSGFGIRWIYDKYIVSPKGVKKDIKRCSQIRTLVKESFKWNLELLERMQGMMENEKVIPTFNVDIPILESTAGLIQFEVLDDVEAYKMIDRGRYELSHVVRKVNWMADMYMQRPRQFPLPDTTSLRATDEVYYELVRSTLTLIKSCQGDCRKAIAELERLEIPESPRTH